MTMPTADKLITRMRNLGMIHSTSSDASQNSDLLLHLNDALRETVVPQFAMLRENYYIERERRTVKNIARIRVPKRAMWNKLLELWWIDGTNGDRQQLNFVSDRELHAYNNPGEPRPVGFLLESNDLLLIPDVSPSFDGEVEFVFYFRPGELVLPASAGKVATVDSTTQVTLESTPPSTFTDGTKMDIHSSESGAEIKEWDLTIAAGGVSGNQITFDQKIDGSTFGRRAVEVGDYVVLANEAALPGIPEEWVPLLIRTAVNRYNESVGDAQNLQVGGAMTKQVQELNFRNAEQRVENKPIRLGGKGTIAWGRRWFR